MADQYTYVVTGGGGFLGKALCERLVTQGHRVVSISRGDYPELREKGIESIQCDISSEPQKIERAFQGARCVFHTAAKVEMWGKYEDFFRTNVQGTRNVITACMNAGVSSLVFTSSPSVIASGIDLNGVDESIPYPLHYDSFYPATKALAEQEVLKANNELLHTVALRPHLIYGPGDTSLEALVIKRAQQGRLVRIGNGENLVDFSFIEDCVSAHINASMALESNPVCRGKAYFISQGIPIKLWEWIDTALKKNNLPSVKRSVPVWFATRLGKMLEILSLISGSFFEPPFTKFLAEEMATNHYFDISAAKRDLGYEPKKKDLLNW